MADPLSSVSYRDLSWPELPSDGDHFREDIAQRTDDRVTREHATVVGAAIWGDATAVSNACRLAKPATLDDVLCDDGALQKTQKWLADSAEKALQLALGAKMGRSK